MNLLAQSFEFQRFNQKAMKFQLPLVLITLFVFSYSCSTTQDIPDDLNTLNKKIQMDKNPCFGTCPHYTLTIYGGRFASFEGKRDVEKLGLYTKMLTAKEYKVIQRAFEKSDFFELKDNYPSNLPDLPKTTIRYHKNEKFKTVTGDEISRPKVVLTLDSLLSQIAESDGWTLKQTSQND